MALIVYLIGFVLLNVLNSITMQKISQKYDKAEGYIGICSYSISFCVIFILIMRHEEYKELIVYFGWGTHGIYDLALALSIAILIYVFRMTFLIKNAKIIKIYFQIAAKAEDFYKIIIAPICEEILYRNLLLADMLKSHNLLFSAFAVSFIFSISHLHYEKFVYFFVCSFIFSYLFYFSGSVLYSIFSHILYNLLCCAIVVQTDSNE